MLYELSIDKDISELNVYINKRAVTVQNSYHAHNFIEINLVTEGRGTHKVGGDLFDVEPGALTIINYDVPHQFTASEPLMVYNCMFTTQFLDQMLNNSRNFSDIASSFLLGNFYKDSFSRYIHQPLPLSTHVFVKSLLDRMLDEFTNRRVGYREIMRGCLIELLITVFRVRLDDTSRTYDPIYAVIQYIGAHYASKITKDELLSITNTSYTKFAADFKSVTSQTVTDFIQSLRIQQACHLLRNTDKNISQIAEEVGYEDLKHFYHVFRKITGATPKCFRS